MAKGLDEKPAKQISGEQLVALIKGKLSGDSAASTAREHIKDKIAGAVENANLHRKAFNIVAAAAKMDEMKRNDLKAALDLYWDMASEKGLFGTEHHGDLVGHNSVNAEDQEDDVRPEFLRQQEEEREAVKAQNTTNVTRLKRGIKPLDQDEANNMAAG